MAASIDFARDGFAVFLTNFILETLIEYLLRAYIGSIILSFSTLDKAKTQLHRLLPFKSILSGCAIARALVWCHSLRTATNAAQQKRSTLSIGIALFHEMRRIVLSMR